MSAVDATDRRRATTATARGPRHCLRAPSPARHRAVERTLNLELCETGRMQQEHSATLPLEHAHGTALPLDARASHYRCATRHASGYRGAPGRACKARVRPRWSAVGTLRRPSSIESMNRCVIVLLIQAGCIGIGIAVGCDLYRLRWLYTAWTWTWTWKTGIFRLRPRCASATRAVAVFGR